MYTHTSALFNTKYHGDQRSSLRKSESRRVREILVMHI